jgi:hypothetical protein
MAASSRDFIGYGTDRPTLSWPGGAQLAISLVVNYEEGSERSFAAGDPDQEPMTEWGSYPLHIPARTWHWVANAGPDDMAVLSFPAAELPTTERRDGAR